MWDFDAFEATVGIKGWIREGWGEWDLLRWGVWFLLYIWVWEISDESIENCWSGESYERWVIGWELWEVGDRLRVMRDGWLLNTQVQRRELLLVGWELWEVGEFFHFWGESWVRSKTWGRAQRREERWDRGEETKLKKKKLISSQKKEVIFTKKSWLNVLHLFTNLPSKTFVQCSKSPPPTF